MDTLVREVIYATGLRREIVKPAIGYVLQFLRNEAPEVEAHVDEFISKLRAAREALQATAVIGGGTSAAIKGLRDSMEHEPHADAHHLACRLAELGLNETQIANLMKQVVLRAKDIASTEDVAKIRQLLSALDRHFESDTPCP